jgi:hypothetical protein
VVTVTKAATPAPPPPRGSRSGDGAGFAVSAAAGQFFSRLYGTATVQSIYTFLNADESAHTFRATWNRAGSQALTTTDTATLSKGTDYARGHAGGWSARIGEPFDPDVYVLDPGGVDAFFEGAGRLEPILGGEVRGSRPQECDWSLTWRSGA